MANVQRRAARAFLAYLANDEEDGDAMSVDRLKDPDYEDDWNSDDSYDNQKKAGKQSPKNKNKENWVRRSTRRVASTAPPARTASPLLVRTRGAGRRGPTEKDLSAALEVFTLQDLTSSELLTLLKKEEEDRESSFRKVPGNKSKPLRLLWEARAAEERRPHSFTNPFIPTKEGDIDRWIAQKSPGKLKDIRSTQVPAVDPVKIRAIMRAQSNGHGHSNNIVEEYLSPSDIFADDFNVFKQLRDDEKRAVIQREAEEYGLEKPQGYSVSFHYNPHVEYHHFGSSHPMKPWRLTLTKQLVLAYGLEYTMDLYEPRPATFEELAIFHDRQYLDFLSRYALHLYMDASVDCTLGSRPRMQSQTTRIISTLDLVANPTTVLSLMGSGIMFQSTAAPP